MNTNICAFSSSDNDYALKASIALLSIRAKNSNIDLFLIGHKFSKETKKLLTIKNIQTIELDLRSQFNKAWEYPIECYYLFAGPELFYDYGYDYSIYIDGDVLCTKDPLIGLSKLVDFAGVRAGTLSDILGAYDFDVAIKAWPRVSKSLPWLQSGVLYFNNRSLKKMHFLEKISLLYSKAKALNIPRKGDDSLFALFVYVYPEYSYKSLSRNHNYIEFKNENKNISVTLSGLFMRSKLKLKFYHFSGLSSKPWEVKGQKQYINSTNTRLIKKWRDIAKAEFSQTELTMFLHDNLD
jgi:lipopolysaccharide biosynthesis glycosyltransferase